MQPDHIFIFTTDPAKNAEELISFGLTEGSSRVHEGQGTSNRTFVFENFYFEILWVHNDQELKSDLVKPSGLWKRANYKTTGCSPFGLCITNTDETDELFKHPLKYQPAYFPQGMAIDILNAPDDLPWIFRLPFKGDRKKESKPPAHPAGIQKLTGMEFTYSSPEAQSYIKHFRDPDTISFSKASTIALTLAFDQHRQGKTISFPNLHLRIEY
jgi:hypothetical protein